MRKSLLLKQNNELFDKLQIASLNNRRLREENEKLKEKVAILSSRLEGLQATDTAISEPTEVVIENENSVTEQVLESQIEEAVPAEPQLSPEIEYGSKIIGDIIINSTESVNQLMSSNKENIKELVNLIMGKTEVAKAEVLDIVSSDSSFECKTAMLDSLSAEAKEYFKSVLFQ